MRLPCRSFFLALALATAACTAAPRTAPAPLAGGPYDLVIENGRVVDGTGAAWFFGDVAVRGDRIVRIAPRGVLAGTPATARVDATGLVVAPGFIDIQGHSGSLLLSGDSRVVGKISQGVTTEILGEGSTPAPLNPARLAETLQGAESVDTALVRRFAEPHGFDNWLRAMEARGVAVNVGSFVGAGTIRVYGMGLSMGAATGSALDSMRAAVRRAMEDGAFGMASALIYPPNTFASTEELIEEAKAMSPYGGVYITHMRSEADKLLEAIDEAIRIGARGGVGVEIYHLKAAGLRNWPKARAAIAKIDSARAAGVDVQANMYPYTAGGTGLTSCLPPAMSAEGKLFENLADPAMRARIRAEVEHPTSDWEDLCSLATPANVLITDLRQPGNAAYVGKRLSEIATMMGKDYLDAAMDLILSERRRVETIYFLMSEDNVKLQLQQPWMKIGTDAGGPDPDSVRALLHPRSFGTYPRILGRYVRDERVLPLEDAIRKMSSAVATRLSIHDRGVLKPGMFADIVVLDPATIADRATFEAPRQLSTGVRYVWVNGTLVWRDGRHTGARPGRIVRGPGYGRQLPGVAN
jgi:dihydroorotase/N-acyl-D-amino-acid deacylase